MTSSDSWNYIMLFSFIVFPQIIHMHTLNEQLASGSLRPVILKVSVVCKACFVSSHRVQVSRDGRQLRAAVC